MRAGEIEQITAIFKKAEIESKRSAVDHGGPDGHLVARQLGKPHSTITTQTDTSIELIDAVEPEVVRIQFFRMAIDCSAHRSR